MRRYQLAIDVTGSVEGVYAFIYWNEVDIWTGKTVPQRTDWQTLKDMATQLLIKCKSGALVTRLLKFHFCLFPLLQDFAHIGHKLIWVIKLHCVQGKATSMKTNVLPADQFSVQPTVAPALRLQACGRKSSFAEQQLRLQIYSLAQLSTHS